MALIFWLLENCKNLICSEHLSALRSSECCLEREVIIKKLFHPIHSTSHTRLQVNKVSHYCYD